MLKKSEVSEKGLKAFRECLKVIPALRIDLSILFQVRECLIIMSWSK